MTETTVQMDDKELWAAVTDNEPAEVTGQPEAADEGAQPRDEHGRFAPKQEAEPAVSNPEPVAAQEPEKDVGIPSWRLKEEAEARRQAIKEAEDLRRQHWQTQQELAQLRQQLQQFQAQKQEPVDPYADLPGAIKQTISPFEDRVSSFESKMVLRASRAEAVVDYGREAVTEMEAAIQKAIQSGDPEMQLLSMQMRSSDHPVGIAMKWHQNNKLVSQTGGDIEAFKAKLLQDPEFLGKALEAAKTQAGQQKPSTVVQLPPSLNKAAASMPVGSEDNDMSDAALFRYATSR